MARYTKNFSVSVVPEHLFAEINQYLTGEGYTYQQYGGENVYKKGNGWVAAPTFIKLNISGNSVRLEAWLKFAILPGVYAGEMDLEGFVGAVPKSALKTRVMEVERIIGKYASAPNFGYGAPNQNPYGAPNPYEPNFGGQNVPPQPNNFGQPPQENGYAQQPQPQNFERTQPAQSVFCPKCGERLDSSAVFCYKCGNKVK